MDVIDRGKARVRWEPSILQEWQVRCGACTVSGESGFSMAKLSGNRAATVVA